MADALHIKKGLEANLPKLAAGEFAFTTDTKKLYVGDGEQNVCINDIQVGMEVGNAVVVQEGGKIAPELVPEPTSIDASKLTGVIDLGTF